MNKAEKLLQDLFFKEGEYIFWKLLHAQNVKFEEHEFVDGNLFEFKTESKRGVYHSYDDKPACIYVHDNQSDHTATLIWYKGNQKHRGRERGPAVQEIYRDGSTVDEYWEDGKKLKR